MPEGMWLRSSTGKAGELAASEFTYIYALNALKVKMIHELITFKVLLLRSAPYYSLASRSLFSYISFADLPFALAK